MLPTIRMAARDLLLILKLLPRLAAILELLFA